MDKSPTPTTGLVRRTQFKKAAPRTTARIRAPTIVAAQLVNARATKLPDVENGTGRTSPVDAPPARRSNPANRSPKSKTREDSGRS